METDLPLTACCRSPEAAAFGMLEAICGRIMGAARHRIAEHAPYRFAVGGMDAVEKAVDMRERGRIIGAPEFGHRAAPVDRARAGIIAPRRDSRKIERAFERPPGLVAPDADERKSVV